MPRRHPSDALLTDYASGSVRVSFGVVIAAHLEACGHCRATLAGLEALGGEMMDCLPQTALRTEAVSQALAGIERPFKAGSPTRRTEARTPFGPELWLGPGIGVRKAKLGDGGLLYRLRVRAGQVTFPHGHRGVEYTAVLKGAFYDGFETYAAGDFAEADEGLEHLPHVTQGGECVCLIASEQPLRAMSLIGRFIQAIAGV